MINLLTSISGVAVSVVADEFVPSYGDRFRWEPEKLEVYCLGTGKVYELTADQEDDLLDELSVMYQDHMDHLFKTLGY